MNPVARVGAWGSAALRRAVDVVVASLGLLVLAPLLAATAVAIRVRMGRGILFRQRRLGLAGRPFVLLKFRTMHHPAPGREGPEFDEFRLGRLGRLLRASSIDELPSLWNLLRGDVTLVGPRPLPVHYWPRYRGDEYRRFEVKPGITGLAQVHGRNLVDWPERLALDVRYVEERSLTGDLRILARTVPMVLTGSGVSNGQVVTMHALPKDRPGAVDAARRPVSRAADLGR
ncbi:MAG: sugar transferase [Actinomycetes bacterium]|jgi:sugar transferase EpsL